MGQTVWNTFGIDSLIYLESTVKFAHHRNIIFPLKMNSAAAWSGVEQAFLVSTCDNYLKFHLYFFLGSETMCHNVYIWGKKIKIGARIKKKKPVIHCEIFNCNLCRLDKSVLQFHLRPTEKKDGFGLTT